MNPHTNVTIERKTLIRLAAIALAFDVITPNRDELDKLYSDYLRKEIKNLPLTATEFKDMMTITLNMIENNRA